MKQEKQIQLALRDIGDKLDDIVHQQDEILRRLYRITPKPPPNDTTQVVGGPFDLWTL